LASNLWERPLKTILGEADGQIAYSDAGAGEPVVMLHCSSASGSEWRSLATRLGEGWRTIAVDQWGCGESAAWPGRRPFSLQEEAEPVVAILRTLGGRAQVVGHSYGAAVALKVARMAPKLVSSLTLVEPSCFHVLNDAPAAEELVAEVLGVGAAVAKACSAGDYWAGMGGFVDYWSGAGAWAALPEAAKAKMAPRVAKLPLDFRALIGEPGGVEGYAAIAAPALLICGEATRAPSRRIVGMLAATLRNVRVATIPGAGHMSPLTHPDAVNDAVAGHLQSCRAA
jgi:pimeloyl-ACP methyl ester carboxylesterase